MKDADSLKPALLSKDLLSILFHEGGIQKMVDTAHGYLENSIYVFDAGYHLAAATWDVPANDEETKRILAAGGMEERDIQNINHEFIHERVRRSGRPVLIQNAKYSHDRIVGMIDLSKDVGHIVVVADNRAFQEIDYELCDILRGAIDQQLKKDEFTHNAKGANYEFLLRDLLDEKVSKSLLDSRLPNVDREFAPPFFTLVVETVHSPNIIPPVRVRTMVEEAIPGVISTIYNGRVVVLLTGKCRVDRSVIDKFCQKWKLLCGLSNPFLNILHLSVYYKQALKAIEFGADSASGLYVYEHYYMKHIVNIFAQKEQVEAFCCPALKTLMAYDRKKGKGLSRTLYLYLKNERNAVLTAKQLNIHRNTLIQRLERISELIPNDLNDVDVRLYIILSFEMMAGGLT
jgi:hypothetical protein